MTILSKYNWCQFCFFEQLVITASFPLDQKWERAWLKAISGTQVIISTISAVEFGFKRPLKV